ncbi:hypothetical protein [Aeoliella sp.]|uniref:hypothetical protein n=1 Tax=Aeoliella sp. TaxID=2795800 RepID=UPI003CCB84E3
MNIIEAIHDENLFRRFLDDGGDLSSWSGWLTTLRAVYGLPIRSRTGRQVIKDVADRDASQLPESVFHQSLFLTGRRSGKSRIASVVAGYESLIAGHEKKLHRGEQGVVAVISPTRGQSKIVKDYIDAILQSTPLLRKQVVRTTKNEIELQNGISILILAGDYRMVRGFSLIAAIVDEVAFFGCSDESRVKSDTELVRAILPGLSTTGGRLIAISSPFAKRGWAFSQWQKCFGNNLASTLVVNAPSRSLNPTLPQSIVDAALAEDLASAKSEYLGEFRDDVAAFVSREIVEACVVAGRTELQPTDRKYYGFVDISGGRHDDATLAIAHRRRHHTVIDRLAVWRPPFNPYHVIREMGEELRRYGVSNVTGDAYSAEFVEQAFKSHGVRYHKCKFAKSQLYIELLPLLSAKRIELPDISRLVDQLSFLERRARSGSRDIVDHATGNHDDLANAIAGAAWLCGKRRTKVGALQSHSSVMLRSF